MKADYLSQEFGLIRPDLENSVSGIFPTIFSRMNLDTKLDPKKRGWVENENLAQKLQESFPSGFDNVVMLICDGVGVERLQKLGGHLWDNLSSQGTIASKCIRL